MSQPAVSKHLRILREAGLVEVRGDAQRRLYRVHPALLDMLEERGKAARDGAGWHVCLDALEAALRDEPAARHQMKR